MIIHPFPSYPHIPPLPSPSWVMENNNSKQPLLSSSAAAADDNNDQVTSTIVDDRHGEEEDIPPIESPKVFLTVFWMELKKTMYLAAPATFMRTCQYSLGAITITFSGQLNTLDLAAFSVENSVIAGFSFGVLVRHNTTLLLFLLLSVFFINIGLTKLLSFN